MRSGIVSVLASLLAATVLFVACAQPVKDAVEQPLDGSTAGGAAGATDGGAAGQGAGGLSTGGQSAGGAKNGGQGGTGQAGQGGQGGSPGGQGGAGTAGQAQAGSAQAGSGPGGQGGQAQAGQGGQAQAGQGQAGQAPGGQGGQGQAGGVSGNGQGGAGMAGASPQGGMSGSSDCPGHLVVNEVSPEGDTITDEYVELYNPTDCMVSLDGWKLLYSSAKGSSPSTMWTALSTDFISAKGYFVIGGTDYLGPIQGEITAGGLKLDGGAVGLHDTAGLVDAVAWGTATSSNPFAEGTPAGDIPAGQSAGRLPNGTDTDHNDKDFSTPSPRTPGAKNK